MRDIKFLQNYTFFKYKIDKIDRKKAEQPENASVIELSRDYFADFCHILSLREV